MTTPAQTVFLALKTQLATIAVSGGYQTTVKTVMSGKPDLEITETKLPALLLLAIDERPSPSGNAAFGIEAGLRAQYWARKVLIEGQVTANGDWEAALDALLQDTRRALTRFPYPLVLEGPTFVPPSEGRNIAAFVMFVEFNYDVNFFE